ncbi:MAG: PAS domain S-box protein [Nitrospinae bacterium]|nr:PAS domain S-box protein [Nitrospinota bacterium]
MVENNPEKPQAGLPAKEILSSASEIKYRILIEASPDATVLADAETGFFLDCNKAAENLLGRTREEIIGLHITKLHPPQEAKLHNGQFKKQAEKAFGSVENISVLHKKGHSIPVEIRTAAFELEGKKVIYGIFRNISERVEAEQLLITAHQRLLAVLDGLEAVVYVADIKTYEVLFINKYARNVIGDILGGICWKTIQAGQAGPCAFCTNNKIVDDAGRPTEAYSWEFQNTKNGRWYQIRDRAIDWVDGRLVRLEIALDITEGKAAEVALRESEELLRSITDNAGTVIFLKDLAGRYLHVNRLYEKLFHVSNAAVKGKTDYDLFPRDVADAFIKNDKMVAQAGRTLEMEERVPHDDGIHTYISVKFPIRHISGEIYAICGIATDITERKHAEESLREAREILLKGKEELVAQVNLKTQAYIDAHQEAENATRLKNNFISLVAHDLKSPLASLTMGLEALASVKDLSPESRDFAKKMANHSRQIHKMTERLLDITLLRAGVTILQKRVINCHNFAATQIELYETMAAQKGITIVNGLPLKMSVHADPDLFGECVKNLLSNAVKFCSRGDTVTFFNPPDMPTTIAVKDTGPGIAPEKMPPLFIKETKTRTVGTAGEKGTGIGLIHTKEIMEVHGGSITFESEAGAGSVFYLNLPVFDNVVLVVDDDEASTLVLRLHLMNMGSDVLTAQNGVEALEIIQGRLPILIITDIQMPMMDGFTLLHHLKANPEYSQIPVIIITGSNEIDARKKAFANKAVNFIIKPLSEPDFIPRIGRFIAG